MRNSFVRPFYQKCQRENIRKTPNPKDKFNIKTSQKIFPNREYIKGGTSSQKYSKETKRTSRQKYPKETRISEKISSKKYSKGTKYIWENILVQKISRRKENIQENTIVEIFKRKEYLWVSILVKKISKRKANILENTVVEMSE